MCQNGRVSHPRPQNPIHQPHREAQRDGGIKGNEAALAWRSERVRGRWWVWIQGGWGGGKKDWYEILLYVQVRHLMYICAVACCLTFRWCISCAFSCKVVQCHLNLNYEIKHYVKRKRSYFWLMCCIFLLRPTKSTRMCEKWSLALMEHLKAASVPSADSVKVSLSTPTNNTHF